MTTDGEREDAATAAENEEQKNEGAVQDALNDVADEIERGEEEKPEGERLSRDEILQLVEERFEPRLRTMFQQQQGRAQQWYGNLAKETANELTQETQGRVNEVIDDLMKVLDEDQREALQQVREQRERERTNQRLRENLEYVEKLRNGEVSLGGSSEQQQGVQLTQEQAQSLTETVSTIAESMGVEVSATDPKVWTGWAEASDYAGLVKVATRNLQGLAKNSSSSQKTQKSQPQQSSETTANDRVPPSTTGAPMQPSQTYASLGELARAYKDGEIDINQYRTVGRENGWIR